MRVKICGLTRAEDVAAACAAGAAYVGLVFYGPSPRNVTPDQGRALAWAVPPGVVKVGLVVDAPDETLDPLLGLVPLDMLQLHGHESPERVAALRARHGLPVMKAVGLSGPEDLPQIDIYAQVADQILVDAKPPRGTGLPGGNGLSFDWRLIAGRRWPCPWMLAGGLNPANVAAAVALTGARQIDVSSGVESAPGLKDGERMARLIAAAQPRA